MYSTYNEAKSVVAEGFIRINRINIWRLLVKCIL